MPKDPSTFAPFDTSVVDLGRSGICVHLGKLQLRLGPCSWRESGVADDVAKGLSDGARLSAVKCGVVESGMRTVAFRTVRKLCVWCGLV